MNDLILIMAGVLLEFFLLFFFFYHAAPTTETAIAMKEPRTPNMKGETPSRKDSRNDHI